MPAQVRSEFSLALNQVASERNITVETILAGYPWLEREDVLACIAYAHRLVEHERVEPLIQEANA